jgi:hypothetical protein
MRRRTTSSRTLNSWAGSGTNSTRRVPHKSSRHPAKAALQNLVKIQFEFSAYSLTANSGAISDPTPVSFDVEIDNVSFY